MSEIQNDKDIIQEGRSALEKVEEASLKDQIPKKLLAKLRDMDYGVKLDKLWTAGEEIRSEWLSRQRTYLKDWDEFVVPTIKGAFAQSANLHLPMPFIVCKTYHARMLSAINSLEPGVKPRRPDSVERSDMVSDLLKYTMDEWCNEYQGASNAIDEWVWEWVTVGSSVLKWGWDVKYAKYIDVVTDAEVGLPTFTTDPETGAEISIPSINQVEREKEVVVKTVDCPALNRVNIEDIVIHGGQGDPQKADAVLQRQYLTASDLWTLVDRKVFDEEAVKKIIQSGPDVQDSQLAQDRESNAGVNAIYSESDLDRYEILECYVRASLDNSGINSDLVVWCHRRSKALPRATYLYRINKAGERPFVKIDFFKRLGQTYGMGLPEVLFPLSRELDAMHNIRIDYGIVSTMPFGFYRANSSLNPTTIQLEPGQLIPVDDPQGDVYFPNIGNRSAFGMNEEAAIQNYIERLTGISELSLGVISGNQGAARTATGARSLIQEANANLDVHLKRLFGGWKRMLEYLVHMLQQRIPRDMSFRITGDDGNNYWRYIRDKQDIAGDYDFSVDPASAKSNPQVQQEISQALVQLTSNPLDIQLGIVTPDNRYNALKSLIMATQIKDFAKYITKPNSDQYNYKMSPEEEANRILRGIPVPVGMGMDHEGFIRFFENIYQDDELLGQFNENQTIMLKQQAIKHEQMLAALKQQQAQAQQFQQQAINAQTAGQQTMMPAMGQAPSQPPQTAG